MEEFRQNFCKKAREMSVKKDENSAGMTKEQYSAIVQRLTDIQQDPQKKKLSADYRMLKKYDLMEVRMDGANLRKLVKQGTGLRFVTDDELFNAIHSEHVGKGHGGRDITYKATSEKYANVTKEHINLYLSLCEACQLKKSKVRKSMVVRPIVSNDHNSRCQVDLIDMQSEPDRDFSFILNYQDHLTKFVVLRALKTKRAEEVAYHLVDIFCDRGAPHILQSDNGREFANKVVKEVLAIWPDCHLVHGKPRHSQSQGSVERANQDVEAILACWKKDNSSAHWSEGLRFVQWMKNTRFHSGIGRSPYEAVFGGKPRLGISSKNLPNDLAAQLETEEDLIEALGLELEAPEEPEDAVESTDNCISCEKKASGAHKCKQCGKTCHAIAPCAILPEDVEEGFGGQVLCRLCQQKEQIADERAGAKRKQQQQADKMKEASAKRFKPAAVGDTVMVPVPEVDRGRAEFPNVKAVVLAEQPNGLYQIGTIHGVLKQLYTRNQFTPCIQQLVSPADVPQHKEVTLREVARQDSIGTGQGLLKCNCSKSCVKGHCRCHKDNRKCNSKCHGSNPCDNKFDS